MAAPVTDTPILDLITRITEDSIETSNLDAKELLLVRLAALVAADAPPASYLLDLGAASELGIDADDVRGVLSAVAPDRRHPSRGARQRATSSAHWELRSSSRSCRRSVPTSRKR